jgi:hypothetical protein
VDKIINAHIDRLEKLDDQIERIVLEEVSLIDIDAVMANPSDELMRVSDNIRRVFFDYYVDKAIEAGFDLGRIIKAKLEQDKTIKIDDSKDPKLNDTGEDNKSD